MPSDTRSGVHPWLVLAGLILLCLAVGWLGSLFTRPAIEAWYAGIRKPVWTPPGWVFGPVWTLLYVMMGWAAWLVWRSCGGFTAWACWPLGLFALQLALNAAWSPAFFGWRSPGAGLAVIVPLWAAIAATLLAFWPISRPAAWLMAPYLAWVSYATALNASLWWLNRGTPA